MYRERFSRAMRTALYVFAYALLVTICHASPVIIKRQNNNTDTQSDKDADKKPDITGQTATGGVVLVIAGLILLFFGQRTYRITLFLIGLCFGASISYVGLVNAEPDDGYSDNPQTLYLAVTLAVGLVIGAAFTWFARLAKVVLWALGVVTGYLCTLYILGWADNGMIKNRTAQAVLFAICIIACTGAIIYKKHKLVGIFTAFVGAYSLMLGVELFVRTGFAVGVRAFTDGRRDIPYDVDKEVYGILGTLEIVFIIGFVIQKRFQPNAFAPPAEEVKEEIVGKGKRWWEKRWWRQTN